MTLPHSRKSCAAISDEKRFQRQKQGSNLNTINKLVAVCDWRPQTVNTKYSHSIQNQHGRNRSYLESISAADVVIGLDRGDDITGQGDAAQHRLLSAVWKGGRDDRVHLQTAEAV